MSLGLKLEKLAYGYIQILECLRNDIHYAPFDPSLHNGKSLYHILILVAKDNTLFMRRTFLNGYSVTEKSSYSIIHIQMIQQLLQKIFEDDNISKVFSSVNREFSRALSGRIKYIRNIVNIKTSQKNLILDLKEPLSSVLKYKWFSVENLLKMEDEMLCNLYEADLKLLIIKLQKHKPKNKLYGWQYSIETGQFKLQHLMLLKQNKNAISKFTLLYDQKMLWIQPIFSPTKTNSFFDWSFDYFFFETLHSEYTNRYNLKINIKNLIKHLSNLKSIP